MFARRFTVLVCAAAATSSAAMATPRQQPETPAAKPSAAAQQPASTTPAKLTLDDALALARKNEVRYQGAVTAAGLAREDRLQARNALLPTVTYNNSVIYTQAAPKPIQASTGVPVVFIANNAVHEYISQGAVHESIDLAGVASLRRARAAAARGRAQAEIASRGLVVTVVQAYYNLAAARYKLEIAQRADEEGKHFLRITQDLERGGEVAHSDVIKAELQANDRQRQLQEAQLALLNARLGLAVLIFPDFNDNFDIADDLHASVPIPTLGEVQQQAARNNPEIRAALAAVQAANHDVSAARFEYFPTLTLDYFYGIDAEHFALHSTVLGQRVSNLGSSIVGTLNIPVWNWGTTQSRVRQAGLRRAQAERELSFAQRSLLAEIQSLYKEASTASDELAGLARSAQLAEESQRLTALRYQHGEATVLEVVDAQNTFASSNAAYQDGAVRFRVALANLQTLTGELTHP